MKAMTDIKSVEEVGDERINSVTKLSLLATLYKPIIQKGNSSSCIN